MKRLGLSLLALLAVPLLPRDSFSQIYEYGDGDGNVSYYKYVDGKGSTVFTDNLAGIPPEVRKSQKIVRLGPPPGKKKAAAPKPLPEAPPSPPPPPPVTFEVPKPVPTAGGEEGSGLPIALLVVLGVGALAAAAVVIRRLSAGKAPAPKKPRAPERERERRPHEPPEHVETSSPAERMQQALKRHLQAKDYGSAARLCEANGDLEAAARYYREAGNFVKAGELFAAEKDYRSAAVAYEAAGNGLKAAELYEAAFLRENPDGRDARGSDDALRSGRLFEKAGEEDRALGVYVKAKLFDEAAPLFERKQDFARAAEGYCKAGNLEKAAECFDKGGDPARSSAMLSSLLYDKGLVREAAEHAEKAGDPVRAAELYQEAKEFGKAGELYCRAGLYDEAGENYALADDQAGAAEAFERGGKYLLAAKACEGLNAPPQRIAELYEKGEDFYAAGRLFVRAGLLDRGLNALQNVDADSEHARSASLLIGMLFLKKGMIGLAQERFVKLIGNAPVDKKHLDPWYFLAICHEQAGRANEARAILEKILAVDYTFRDVKRRLEHAGKGKK